MRQLLLAFCLAASPVFAQSPAPPAVHIPDLRLYGFGGLFPEPVEIDDDPLTIEFLLYGMTGQPTIIVNPRRPQVAGFFLPCWENVSNPLPNPEVTTLFQTTRSINGRTWLVSWGTNIVTGATAYDLRPLEFLACK